MDSVARRGALGDMSKVEDQLASPVRDEVAALVARAREAAASIEHYTQEQVDALVTAMAWAVVRKDNAEMLARLAVDEGGFGNYADKVAKISKRVTGVLADMAGLRTVGGGGGGPPGRRSGQAGKAGRGGRRADPGDRPGRHAAGQGAVRGQGAQRD